MQAEIQLRDFDRSGGPARLVECVRRDEAGERRVQQIRWPEAGQTRVRTGATCVFELFLEGGEPEAAHTDYLADVPGRGRQAVGSVNFVPPHSSLQLHWSAGSKRSFVCLLDPGKLGPLGGLDWDWADVDPLAALDIRSEKLRATLQWLAEETMQPSFASELCTQSLLTVLSLEARRHLGRDAAKAPAACRGRLSPAQVARTQEIISACHDPAGPSLADLAGACGLPAREFSEMFKNTLGVTLRSYVAQAHLDKARILLADPRLLVKQVAYRCGFESASAFGSAFRRATGSTPAQYRQSLLDREVAFA